jgi:biopolymer transport protein ExbD
MKMRGAKAVHYDSGPNMTPLVDVVMVILIFLMLTGSFGAASHFLPSTMPITQKGKGGVSNVPKTDPPKLTIKMFTQGETFVASSPDLGREGGGQPKQYRTVEDLRDALRLKRREKTASGMKADDMQIIIAPNNRTKFEHVMNVYEAAMAARWPKIGFQAASN